MKTILLIPALVLVLATGSGCISTEKTNYRGAERVKVAFENDRAGRLFYETLHKSSGRINRSESNTEVSIPIIFDHKQRTVDGENIVFNSAVRHCDTDGDGKITELEARIFSENAAK